MVTRRERFERVYALTEAVAPPSALREVDEVEAEDVLVAQGRRRGRSDAVERNRIRLYLRPQGDPGPAGGFGGVAG